MDISQHLINGLLLGSVYALIALGYTMVFGVLRMINFAHSEVYMMGAFAGYYTGRWILKLGIGSGFVAFGLTLLLAMVGSALLGFLIERFAYRPLRKAPPMNLLITAVGVSLLLQFSGQLFFGVDPKFFPPVLEFHTEFLLGGVSISQLQLVVLAVSISLMFALQFLVFGTKWGRAMRAVSYNSDVAGLLGINSDRIISSTFVLGSALAGAAGVLVGLVYPKIEPMMGVMLGLKAFVAAVLGGIGNVVGAVLGSIILGLSEEFVVAFGSSTYRDALAFSILVGILLFRPSGILVKSVKEKV